MEQTPQRRPTRRITTTRPEPARDTSILVFIGIAGFTLIACTALVCWTVVKVWG